MTSTKVELYKITLPPHGTYRFTSADEDLVYDGDTYKAIAISRGERSNSADIQRKTTIRISMPVEEEFARLYELYPPLQDAECIIYEALLPYDSAVVTSPDVLFQGVLLTYGSQARVASFELAPSIYSANRVGPRGVYSSLCRHTLYSRGCGINYDDEKATVNVSAVRADDREIDIEAPFDIPGGYYTAGVLRVTATSDPIAILRQTLSSNDPPYVTTLRLTRWSAELTAEPSTVIAAPGCDYSKATCIARFNNLVNFGGFDSLESIDRSPFFDGWNR
jgi:hypothetical protein